MEELRECCAVSEEQPAKKIGNKKHVDTFFIRIVVCNLFINQFRCKMFRKEIKGVKGDGIKRRVDELIMTMQSLSRLIVLRSQYYLSTAVSCLNSIAHTKLIDDAIDIATKIVRKRIIDMVLVKFV